MEQMTSDKTLIALCLLCPTAAQAQLPVCKLIATGGTIAMKIDPVKKAPVPGNIWRGPHRNCAADWQSGNNRGGEFVQRAFGLQGSIVLKKGKSGRVRQSLPITLTPGNRRRSLS
jgi:hypothetical protein